MGSGQKNSPDNDPKRKKAAPAAKGVLPGGRAELRAILENMDGVFYRNDDEGRIQMVSAGVTNLLGYVPDELIGTKAADLYADPSARDDFLTAIRAAGGVLRDYRTVMRHRDGRLVHVSNSAHVFPIPGRDTPGIEGTVRDVTDEHLAREALAREKERHLRLVDGLSDGVFIVSHGHIRFANKAGLQFLGADRAEDVIGRALLDFFDPARREFVAAWMARAEKGIAEKNHADLPDPANQDFLLREEMLLNLDGEGICADLSAHPMVDPQGNGSLQVVVHDVTERKAEEAMLRLSDRVFYDSPDIIAVIGRDFRYQRVNAAYTDFYGHPQGRVVGCAVPDLMGHEKFDTVVRPRMELCLAGEKVQYEDWFTSPLKGQRYMHVSYTPMEGPRGRIDGLIVVSRDITERKQAEDRLVDMNEKLERGVRERTRSLEKEIRQRRATGSLLREKEKRFRVIAETSPAAIFLSDHETGEIFYANPAAARLFGYDMETLLQTNGIELYVDRYDRRRTLDGLEKGESYVPRQEHYRRGDGSTFWGMRSTSRSIIDGRDTLVTVLHDIDDLKVAEAALRQNEQRFRDIVETASDWFWEMDADLRFTLAPSSFYKEYDLKPEDYIGKTRLELAGIDFDNLGHAERKKWQAHLDDLDNRRPFQNFEFEITMPRGGARIFQVSGMPFFDGDKTFLGYRGSTTDITERKQAENEIKAARDAAQRATKAKSEFMAAMSHELRTPLNAIIGFSEMMTRELMGPMGNDSYLQYAENIHGSGDRLLTIINDILDISMIESGGISLREDAVSVSVVIETVFQKMSAEAEAAGVSLSVSLPDDVPFLMGDERRLSQALRNLLDNAIRFTPAGGRVVVSAHLESDGTLCLAVADTGIGMDTDGIKKALEPFVQVDGAINRKYEGIGLGLSLAKRLVEAHDGGLRVDSTPNEGTVITLLFPKTRIVQP